MTHLCSLTSFALVHPDLPNKELSNVFFNFLSQTQKELSSLPSYESRLKKVTEILAGATSYPAADLATAAESFYKKLVAADAYKPTGKFGGEITLVKAQDNYVTLGNDYGLTPVSISTL